MNEWMKADVEINKNLYKNKKGSYKEKKAPDWMLSHWMLSIDCDL